MASSDNIQNSTSENAPGVPSNFIHDIIDEHIRTGRFGGRVHTRFPPEPNGYLHIGHTKAILINYLTAQKYGGKFNLRFDDTNPAKEEQEFIDGIQRDIRWLGVDWEDRLFYASNYFPQLYAWAVELINKGLAYVDDLSADEIREYRGTLTEPGKNSPYRDRTIEENLDLFQRMKNGEFPEGSRVLRAKIDMAAPNLNLRDPVMYRILYAEHPRTGNAWCIYPMYDWAHGQSDSIEGVTHSLCSLEFENNRPLYDWFLDQLGIYHPQQVEFARLNVTYVVMSKRMLIQLVREGYVRGWDDPRMPTLTGMRRRGYTPEAIRAFVEAVGVAKAHNIVDMELLEHHVRQDLNLRTNRVMGVLDPLKVIIENYPEDQIEMVDAVNNPEDESAGSRQVPFGKVLYIEREDFMEDPPKKFFRLAPGREVRLRYAYFITCTGVVKDESGEIVELHCTYDPATRGGDAPDRRKVKATLHWVAADRAVDCEARLYDRLFSNPEPGATTGSFLDDINPDSLQVITHAKLEPSVVGLAPGTTVQFERKGYFCVDPDSTEDALVWNRTATLKDSWAKIQQKSN